MSRGVIAPTLFKYKENIMEKTKENSPDVQRELADELRMLQQQEEELSIAQLKAQIAELKDKLNNAKEDAPQKSQEDVLTPSTYIKVISLIPDILVLSTLPYGQGKIKKFTHFGEMKKIVYSDLVEIMDSNMRFLESGFFYILNPTLIREHGLTALYENILSKKSIDIVLKLDSDEAVTLFSEANDRQKLILVELLIDKLLVEKNVNLNFLDKISRAYGKDIKSIADNKKHIIDSYMHKEGGEQDTEVQ